MKWHIWTVKSHFEAGGIVVKITQAMRHLFCSQGFSIKTIKWHLLSHDVIQQKPFCVDRDTSATTNSI